LFKDEWSLWTVAWSIGVGLVRLKTIVVLLDS